MYVNIHTQLYKGCSTMQEGFILQGNCWSCALLVLGFAHGWHLLLKCWYETLRINIHIKSLSCLSQKKSEDLILGTLAEMLFLFWTLNMPVSKTVWSHLESALGAKSRVGTLQEPALVVWLSIQKKMVLPQTQSKLQWFFAFRDHPWSEAPLFTFPSAGFLVFYSTKGSEEKGVKGSSLHDAPHQATSLWIQSGMLLSFALLSDTDSWEKYRLCAYPLKEVLRKMILKSPLSWECEKIAGVLHLGHSHILSQTLLEMSNSGDRDTQGDEPHI